MSDSDRLASRLAAAIRAGHRFDSDLSYDPERCGCESCLRGDAIMAELNQPATAGRPGPPYGGARLRRPSWAVLMVRGEGRLV